MGLALVTHYGICNFLLRDFGLDNGL